MWLISACLLPFLVAIAIAAQTPFSTITDPHARADAVRHAGKQLAGRTDPAAIAQWNDVLAEMHLSGDPELKGMVQSLRALNLYDNESWINLVNTGYAYLDDRSSARQFRNELARQNPDSSWAIRAAIQQWESTHQPRSTTQEGFIEWGMARLAFLKRLHEQKPHSEAAASEYLQSALAYQSRLATEEALAVADMAIQAGRLHPFDAGFDVVRIYLDHHARMDEVPRVLNEILQDAQRAFRDRLASMKDIEAANRTVIQVQMRAHSLLAEYWFEKNDVEQARAAARLASADLMRLRPAADDPPHRRAFFDLQQKSWSNLAHQVGIDDGSMFPAAKAIDWAKVGRVALDNFRAVDLNGRAWGLQDWKGKVVLVNMWATWCGVCRAELPYIQKLHDALRGRADRLVISINADSDAALARRVIREQSYTFPVLSSRRLADRIDFVNGLPQNRIIDAHGRLLTEPVEGTGDGWVAKVIALMDQVQ
jgi:thiol-disulfide isomerase/thioredoxin